MTGRSSTSRPPLKLRAAASSAIDTRNAEPEHWNEVVPQSESTIEAVSWVGDRFIVSYLEDAHSEVRVFDSSGNPAGSIDLPGIGSTWGFYGKRTHSETFYAYSSFRVPDDHLPL